MKDTHQHTAQHEHQCEGCKDSHFQGMLPNGERCDLCQRFDGDQSAAAELYESHKELLEALTRAVDHLIMSGTKCHDAPEALNQARAAIANATGKAKP